ncbi:tetratricopeptide repeat protein [Candidatus Aquiluna sp. UB-MaderosW2red]|uniref:tetratricopeptide repeat protein n=1 Tax=Candidatus Aquiluna sp. UB-MaderosW2red TaxID=1855377 RepID=UPI000875CBFA|nr:tetratricopeptide repeat protein [Candidatus Aquiluna sp. UB-MaderosW2red]SCX03400.1 Tetratricopeptide repeat-containing protein [Candidatus Aquiluna sp. UB-MaderosW2red]
MSVYEDLSDEELWDRSRSDDLFDRADSLMELGDRKLKAEDWALAKNLFGSSYDLYIQQDRNAEAGKANYSFGYCLYSLKEYVDALEALERSLAIGTEINDSRVIAFSAGPLGDTLAALERPDEAIEIYGLAIDTFAELEEFYSAGINSLSQGELYGVKGMKTSSLASFLRAYNIFQSAGDAFGAARAKDRMASALIELGDYEQALAHIKDALATFEFMEVEERIVHMNYRLGWTHVLAGNNAKARKPLKFAIRKLKEAKEFSGAALAELELITALHRLDDDDQVDELSRRTDRIRAYFEHAGELHNVCYVDLLTAEKFMGLKLHEAAAEIFRDVIERAAVIENRSLIRSSKASLAEALFLMGRHQEAKAVLDEIDSKDWGENQPELDKLEKVKNLMLEKMAETLNIIVPESDK